MPYHVISYENPGECYACGVSLSQLPAQHVVVDKFGRYCESTDRCDRREVDQPVTKFRLKEAGAHDCDTMYPPAYTHEYSSDMLNKKHMTASEAIREAERTEKCAEKTTTKASKFEGLRYDQGKLRYDLIPPDALAEYVGVMTYGAEKYAPRNWEKGMAWSRCVGPLMRHLFAWLNGEISDPETGRHHLAHVAWNALALVAYSKRQIGENDLPYVEGNSAQPTAQHTAQYAVYHEDKSND